MGLATEQARLTQLMNRIAALPSIAEQKALYTSLSAEDRRIMDDRGIQRMWRSRRATEANRRRRQTMLDERAEHLKLSVAGRRAQDLHRWQQAARTAAKQDRRAGCCPTSRSNSASRGSSGPSRGSLRNGASTGAARTPTSRPSTGRPRSGMTFAEPKATPDERPRGRPEGRRPGLQGAMA